MISTAITNPSPLHPSQLQLQQIPPRTQNAVTDVISTSTNLSSGIIPKIGSIVKRFSLNYSGEGLVTDPQRVRTVRVGIRFQVQVDSFLNGNSQTRPRGIIRTHSAPHSIDYNSANLNNVNSPSDQHNLSRSLSDASNKQLALEFSNCRSPRTSPILRRSCNSVGNLKDQSDYQSLDLDLDSSSGVSSLAGSNPQSPVSHRRHSSGLSFHNRINQALTLCRNQLAAARDRDFAGRTSVQVLRRGSSSPERSPSRKGSQHKKSPNMEDSSSYQVLRYFPGSNVNSVREFSWETAAFEKDVRDRVQWLGSKFSGIKIPPFVQSILSSMKAYAVENPTTSVLILALVIACSLPISIFLGFAVATILVSFLGFLFVEGTLLTVASVALGSVVLVWGLITLGFILVGFLGYFTISQIYSFCTGGSDLKHLLRDLPLIGEFFIPAPTKLAARQGPSNPSKLSNGYKMSNGHGPVHHLNSDEEDDEASTVEDDDDEGNVEVVSVDEDETDTDRESPDSDGDNDSLGKSSLENDNHDRLLKQVDVEHGAPQLLNHLPLRQEMTEPQEAIAQAN